ncbi:MAG: PCMD domain-containing protein [Paludibacteraceae bacterium]|nr:PCMD domain-containing protein [Paludibacteraceae bacterium]
MFVALVTQAQERVEMIPYGDFESWTEKQIKESALIGGQTKTLYKIGGSWSSSNAHACALGVDKVSVSVTPERRGEGYCCRMESTLESVKAIGIDFKALATGSIYTGKLLDVVGLKQSSDPNSAIDMGVPFTGRPSALILDYKALIQDRTAVYAPAKTKVKEVAGHDKGHITLILQHRWEENGHVYAYRVGTAVQTIDRTTEWRNDFRVPVVYGQAGAVLKELSNNRHKTHNSEGKMVCIEEVGFREDMAPTHLIVQISAGSMPPFTGCPGNIVWCDNIRLAYTGDQSSLAHAK